ncbi:MAG: hypothetical protein QNJ70_09865 [Xenococcaceae cyanobacterium MO_207.B15]|nr:hypothetical protein [Xenococcaceae cyanobacterium MO_207.B15]
MKNLSILLSEPAEETEVLREKDSDYKATFTVNNGAETREFSIKTNAPFKTKFDGNNVQRDLYEEYLGSYRGENPRKIVESPERPTLQSNHIWFDALYALALEEVAQCSQDEISDGSYNNGQPISAPEGGYFQTGLFWTYVWTRDTSYSMDLSLANIDPVRALNSLDFKLSERREGGNLQIIQDTGTGGSYPISSDRVVWSLGCRALLRQLQGEKRHNFALRSYDALQNTIEHDRQVIFDSRDGLYRGEQSFLDWREQSYPEWTAQDPVSIGMSKALSTNCCHFHALQFAAYLARELGKINEQQKYNQWAENLRQAIRTHLYLPKEQLYSTFITTTLFVPGAARQYDLLGNALAILLDIADEQQAAKIVSYYPHLPKGPSVIWPQQRDTPIYHNQAIWPFVTAYWLRAAKKVKNDQAVTLGISSLVRGAALSLSNMENFDAVSGRVEIESEIEEPRVNSPHQLWSIAGYLSMIHDIIFGITWTDSGIRIAPYITREFRNHLLPNSNQLVLNGLSYRGHQLDIEVNLPPVSQVMEGAYTVGKILLNGQGIDSEIIESMLDEHNVIEVDLVEGNNTEHSPITLVTNLEDYRYRYAPKPPKVDSIIAIDNQLEIKFNLNGENPDEVNVNVYRDGQIVESGLPGNLTTWRDANSEGTRSPSYCYSLETVYNNSKTTSQRSSPFCYWGPNYNRIYSVSADQFSSARGNLSYNHGRLHLEGWCEANNPEDPDQKITARVTAQFTAPHALQIEAGNGFGAINTGIACGVKRLQMTRKLDNGSNQVVADGYLIMPQLGTWNSWKPSSVIFTKVDLIADEEYEIKIFGDSQAINMSSFAHNECYTGGHGGKTGPQNYANISEVKLLSLTGRHESVR